MSKFESILIGIFIGSMIMILAFCMGWWIGYGVYMTLGFTESVIKIGMISGITVGSTINIVCLRKWISRTYYLDNMIWIIFYFVLSIGTIGFFMGVPVFNIIPCILAGLFIGRKSRHANDSEESFRLKLKKVSILNALTLTAICMFSAYLALKDPFTSVNLQGMLNIKSFEITKSHIIGIVVFGWLGLLSIQFILARKIAVCSYKIR